MSEFPEIHLFICTHKKSLDKKSCGTNSDINSTDLRQRLKDICKERWGKRVRINTSGCLGKCSLGAAAVLYPAGKWYLEMKEADIDQILIDIEDKVSR